MSTVKERLKGAAGVVVPVLIMVALAVLMVVGVWWALHDTPSCDETCRTAVTMTAKVAQLEYEKRTEAYCCRSLPHAHQRVIDSEKRESKIVLDCALTFSYMVSERKGESFVGTHEHGTFLIVWALKKSLPDQWSFGDKSACELVCPKEKP